MKVITHLYIQKNQNKRSNRTYTYSAIRAIHVLKRIHSPSVNYTNTMWYRDKQNPT